MEPTVFVNRLHGEHFLESRLDNLIDRDSRKMLSFFWTRKMHKKFGKILNPHGTKLFRGSEPFSFFDPQFVGLDLFCRVTGSGDLREMLGGELFLESRLDSLIDRDSRKLLSIFQN